MVASMSTGLEKGSFSSSGKSECSGSPSKDSRPDSFSRLESSSLSGKDSRNGSFIGCELSDPLEGVKEAFNN